MQTWEEKLEVAKAEKHQGKEGVPSFSEAPQLFKCPGAKNAKKGLPNKDTIYSINGRVCHDILKNAVLNYLEDPTKLIVERVLHLTPTDAPEDIKLGLMDIARKLDVFMLEGWQVISTEEYMELIEDDEVLWTGTGDIKLQRINQDTGLRQLLIPDYKSGWMFVSATNNYQVNGYAVVGAEGQTYDQVFVTILQPNAPVQFIEIDTDECRREYIEQAKKIKEGKRNVCEACLTCIANGFPDHCDETKDIIIEITQKIQITKEGFNNMDNQIISDMAKKFPIAKKGIKNLETWMKDGIDQFPEWHLKKGARTYKILDPQKAKAQVKDVVDTDDLPFGFSDLRKKIKEKRQCSDEEAQTEAEMLLDDNLEIGNKAPSLALIKKSKKKTND